MNQIEGIITVCKAKKMNKKFILTLIFSSVKVSGKTLYSFQCGVSFKPNKNYCKETIGCCGNRSFVFQKAPYRQQKGNRCKNVYHYFCSSPKNTQVTTVESYLNSFTVSECCKLTLINSAELSVKVQGTNFKLYFVHGSRPSIQGVFQKVICEATGATTKRRVRFCEKIAERTLQVNLTIRKLY